jgi:uncharacterized membrane protein YfcA
MIAVFSICNVAGALVGARLALRGGSMLVRKAFIVAVSALNSAHGVDRDQAVDRRL